MRVADSHDPLMTMGAFSGDRAAQAAVAMLRAAGNADTRITVARQGQAGSPPPEMPALSRVFWSGFWWSVIGAIAGAAIGLIVGVLDLGVPGTRGTIAIQVASWTMFVHVLGALLGCYLALDTGDRFAQKADHHDDAATLVVVRAADAAGAADARRILRAAGAYAIEPRA